jgi:hypothetical protein
MAIRLLDESLMLEIFLDKEDSEFEDDICLQFTETCPEDEKIFYAGETNIYITRDQALKISKKLLDVLNED